MFTNKKIMRQPDIEKYKKLEQLSQNILLLLQEKNIDWEKTIKKIYVFNAYYCEECKNKISSKNLVAQELTKSTNDLFFDKVHPYLKENLILLISAKLKKDLIASQQEQIDHALSLYMSNNTEHSKRNLLIYFTIKNQFEYYQYKLKAAFVRGALPNENQNNFVQNIIDKIKIFLDALFTIGDNIVVSKTDYRLPHEDINRVIKTYSVFFGIKNNLMELVLEISTMTLKLIVPQYFYFIHNLTNRLNLEATYNHENNDIEELYNSLDTIKETLALAIKNGLLIDNKNSFKEIVYSIKTNKLWQDFVKNEKQLELKTESFLGSHFFKSKITLHCSEQKNEKMEKFQIQCNK